MLRRPLEPARSQQDLDGRTPVHRRISLGRPVQGQRQVEHRRRVDRADQDLRHQLRQVGPHRRHPTPHSDVPAEHVPVRQAAVQTGRHADVPDGAARPGDRDGGVPGVLRADALQDVRHPQAIRHLADPGDRGVATLGQHIRRPEGPTDRGAGLVPADQDDPFGAQAAGGQHPAQPDRAVTDHHHLRPRSHPGGACRVVPGAHHVREGQQCGQPLVVRRNGCDHQGAVRERDSHRLALTAVHPIRTPVTPVQTGGVDAGAAVRAGAVTPDEGRDDDVTGPHRQHLAANSLHHTKELVSDPARPARPGPGPSVRPQVTAADAGEEHPHDGVRRLEQDGIWHVLHPDVEPAVDDRRLHGGHPAGTRAGTAPRGPCRSGSADTVQRNHEHPAADPRARSPRRRRRIPPPRRAAATRKPAPPLA